jgi:hypothetical protein
MAAVPVTWSRNARTAHVVVTEAWLAISPTYAAEDSNGARAIAPISTFPLPWIGQFPETPSYAIIRNSAEIVAGWFATWTCHNYSLARI